MTLRPASTASGRELVSQKKESGSSIYLYPGARRALNRDLDADVIVRDVIYHKESVKRDC